MDTNVMIDALDVAVADHVRSGAQRMDEALGIQKMPFGYALMLDHDEIYFYWLRYDGRQGPEHWNKWAAYRMAKANYENSIAVVRPEPIAAPIPNS